MLLYASLCTFFALQSTIAETPGICTAQQVKEKKRFVIDRARHAWQEQKYNETIQREVCCEGYQVDSVRPLSCSPICDPACENSDCMSPNTCVCHPGTVMINNSSSSCYDVCDSCVNGECLNPTDAECTCYDQYQRDPRFPHICDPVCSPECINAECSAPSVCECYEGYVKGHQDHVCVPSCTEECVFGTCTAPDICTCLKDYINDKDSPSICLPVCNQTCENGDCYAPDMCNCREGFSLDPWNPYRCVPQASDDYSFNCSSLTLPQAVKYDKNLDCILIRKVVLHVPSNCKVLQSQPGSFCSHLDNCRRDECVLHLRCSIKQINGFNEIQCFLEEEDFDHNIALVNDLTNTTDWTDVSLVISAAWNFNSSLETKEHVIKQWTFQPKKETPVCGGEYFAVEMSECEIPFVKSSGVFRSNSSFFFWMNTILICGFLLLVGAGVGGFLWARHRRLNDPLNYRGEVVQGFYNNECYENQSDNDSDRYSDSPL